MGGGMSFHAWLLRRSLWAPPCGWNAYCRMLILNPRLNLHACITLGNINLFIHPINMIDSDPTGNCIFLVFTSVYKNWPTQKHPSFCCFEWLLLTYIVFVKQKHFNEEHVAFAIWIRALSSRQLLSFHSTCIHEFTIGTDARWCWENIN